MTDLRLIKSDYPTFARLVRDVRREKKLSQTEFGKLFDVGQTAVQAWEKGTHTGVRDVPKAASVLGVTVKELETIIARSKDGLVKNTKIPKSIGRDIKNAIEETRQWDIPVNGRVLAGDLVFDGALGYEMRPPILKGVMNAYAVRIPDNSMAPRYKVGETIWVDPNLVPQPGKDVVVRFNDKSGVIRELVAVGDEVVVQSSDGEERYAAEDVMGVHVLVLSSC